MKNHISIIIVLYNTPKSQLRKLIQYKDFKLLIFDQGKNNNFKIISKLIKSNFEYFHSNKNLGLAKATNFLIRKVKTSFFLFTQIDIKINYLSIINLYKSIRNKKNCIFAGPVLSKNYSKKNLKYKNHFIIQDKIDVSIMMCNLNYVKKIRFFDEDFFLYWEDIDLMRRVKKTRYKIIKSLNAYAFHEKGGSTDKSLNTFMIRKLNFKFGEFLYDLKTKRIRKIKIVRQLLQNLFKIPVNLIFLKFKKVIINTSELIGICKFLNFYVKKILFN